MPRCGPPTCAGRSARSCGGTRTGRSGAPSRQTSDLGGWRRGPSSVGRKAAYGTGCLIWRGRKAWNSGWRSSMERTARWRSGSARGSPRTPACRSRARPLAGRPALGRGRSWLLQRCLPPACPGDGRTTRGPDEEQRTGGALSAVGLCSPEPRRTAVGTAQGVASSGDPIRENCPFLHGRPLPRRQHGVDLVLTGPRCREHHSRV